MRTPIVGARYCRRPGLTPRERECLALAARGLTAAQIADELGVSPHTAERHLLNAAERLGVRGYVAAVRAATAQGLLT